MLEVYLHILRITCFVYFYKDYRRGHHKENSSLRTGSQRGRKKNSASEARSEWESERESASEASGTLSARPVRPRLHSASSH